MNIDILTFLLYNKIIERNEQVKVAESQNQNAVQIETGVNNTRIEDSANSIQTTNKVEQKADANYGKKPLTPYQQYKNSRNQNGKKYFEFYDDVKVYTHNIWDW